MTFERDDLKEMIVSDNLSSQLIEAVIRSNE
jgi:hypothetical protein